MNIRNFEIEGKHLSIIDDAFSFQEIANIYTHVQEKSFIKCNIDTLLHNTKYVDVKWTSEISHNDTFINLVTNRYFTSIPELTENAVQLGRQYVNFSTLDTVDLIHDDCQYDKLDHYTILQYATFTWQPHWHGETVFYNSDYSEIMMSVTFKPGRIVFFDSSIPHSARVPSKLAEYSRYTIATKLALIKK